MIPGRRQRLLYAFALIVSLALWALIGHHIWIKIGAELGW